MKLGRLIHVLKDFEKKWGSDIGVDIITETSDSQVEQTLGEIAFAPSESGGRVK